MLICYAKEILQIVYIVIYAHTMYTCNVCLCVHACQGSNSKYKLLGHFVCTKTCYEDMYGLISVAECYFKGCILCVHILVYPVCMCVYVRYMLYTTYVDFPHLCM